MGRLSNGPTHYVIDWACWILGMPSGRDLACLWPDYIVPVFQRLKESTRKRSIFFFQLKKSFTKHSTQSWDTSISGSWNINGTNIVGSPVIPLHFKAETNPAPSTKYIVDGAGFVSVWKCSGITCWRISLFLKLSKISF